MLIYFNKKVNYEIRSHKQLMAINVQSLQIKLLINNGILFLIKLNLTRVIDYKIREIYQKNPVYYASYH